MPTVLLVETNEIHNELTTEALKRAGHSVLNWEEDTNLETLIKGSEPGQLLIAIELKVYGDQDTGYKIIEKIRSIDSDVPILVQTAYYSEDVKKTLKEMGINSVVIENSLSKGGIKEIKKLTVDGALIVGKPFIEEVFIAACAKLLNTV